MQKFRYGFTLAEALITLVIVGLVMAATMPIVMKAQNAPSEAPWKYITQGALSQNASVFSALGDTSTTVFGSNRVPIDTNITTNTDNVFATNYNPKISVVTRQQSNGNPVVARHLLDFYEKDSTLNKFVSIGKVSFDRFGNLALGANALDAIKHDATDQQRLTFTNTITGNTWADLTVNDAGVITNAKSALNTAIGQYSMSGDRKFAPTNTTSLKIIGNGNTALGALTMQWLSTGNLNTAIGLYSQQKATTGSLNTSVGAMSLRVVTTGNNNVAVGSYSLRSNSTGALNTSVGSLSLATNTTGANNTAIGHSTLRANTTASNNTAIGQGSMNANTTGASNTAVGQGALIANTTASFNTAFGAATLAANTTGTNNTALGYAALNRNTTTSNNVAVGTNALFYNTNNFNTAVGSQSLTTNTSGQSNTGVGYGTLNKTTSGSSNVAIGTNALFANTTGTGNIAIGNNSATNVNDSNKLYIGRGNNSGDVLIFGDMQNKVLTINGKLVINGQAFIRSGGVEYKIVTERDLRGLSYQKATGVATAPTAITAPGTIISDARLKNIIGDNTAGLKEIMQIQVKNYTLKRDKKKEPLVGVIAQELQKVFPNSVAEGRDGYLRIKRDEIFWACVNAVKELNNMFQDITAKITGLEEKIRLLEDTNKLNADKISALERQNKLMEERLTALENNAKKAAKKAEKAEKSEKAAAEKTVVEKAATQSVKTEEATTEQKPVVVQ